MFEVRQEFDSMVLLSTYSNERIQTFSAGNIANHYLQWQTSDPDILKTVSGQKTEFYCYPCQNRALIHVNLSEVQTEPVE